MKTSSLAFAVIAACLGLVLAITPGLADAESIKIGIIAPLTGEMAHAGEDLRNGFLLAHQKSTQRENSDPNHTYTLIFEDNALDLSKTAQAARKLISADEVDVIVSLWPPAANVVAPIAERANIIHYTIAWDPEIARKFKNTFSHQVMVDAYVRETLRLIKSKSARKVAFIQLNESGFNPGADLLLAEAKDYGVSSVDLLRFNAGQRDFRSEITRMKSKQPDLYLIWAVNPEMEIILRQLAEQGVTVPITGFFDVLESYDLVEGVTFISEIAATDQFAQEYRLAYGREFKLKAPNGYDIFNFIFNAYEKHGKDKASTAQVAQYLHSVRDFPGAVGKVAIDQFGNSEYLPSLRKVSGGRVQEIGR